MSGPPAALTAADRPRPPATAADDERQHDLGCPATAGAPEFCTCNEPYIPVFAYGMNLNPDYMPSNAIKVGAAKLYGYRLVWHGYADIAPSFLGAEFVYGGIWLVDDRGFAMLDVREGYPTLYHRKILEVQSAAAATTTSQAWVYYMRQDYRRPSAPNDFYLDVVREGYRFFGLPEDTLPRSCISAFTI